MPAGARLTFAAPVFQVADLPRAIAYYRDRLGFTPEFQYEDFYAGLARDGCVLHLRRAPPTPRDQAAFEATEHLDACFGVDDAAALAAELAQRGATVTVPLRQMPYGDEVYVRDPDGYVVGFVQPAPEDPAAPEPTGPEVRLSELVDALEVTSFAGITGAAYVSRDTGAVYCTSEDMRDADPDLPEDLDDDALYERMPSRNDLDLGRQLVFGFTRRHLPDQLDRVRDFFHQRGAWGRFKDLLQRHSLLDAWHGYEAEAQEEALRDWARSAGFRVVES